MCSVTGDVLNNLKTDISVALSKICGGKEVAEAGAGEEVETAFSDLTTGYCYGNLTIIEVISSIFDRAGKAKTTHLLKHCVT